MNTSIRFTLTGLILGICIMTSIQSMASMPMSKDTQHFTANIPFIKNQGQLHQADVSYYASTFGGSIFVKKTGEWVYNLPSNNNKLSNESWAFQEKLLNTQHFSPEGQAPTNSLISVFKGNKTQWKKNIPAYQNLSFVEVYPGIDVKLIAAANNIEKLFYIKPGASVSHIKIQVDGVNRLSISDNQQLTLQTKLGDINFTAPVAFQNINGEKKIIDVAYTLNKNQYGFTVGRYDASETLIIDPLLASTFIGGNNNNAFSDFEQIHGIEKFGDYVFVAGMTDSSNFPTQLGLNNTYNGGFYDGFISKFSADLSTLVASTFIGGRSNDDIFGLTLDDVGNVYVVGRTFGQGFPLTTGGYRYNSAVSGGTYIAKLDNNLSTLIATALPAGSTLPSEISIGNNSVYISGRTNQENIPVPANAFDTTCGNADCDPSGSFSIRGYFGYIERLDLGLSNLLAATYLGSQGGSDVKISSNSNVYAIRGASVTRTSLASFDADLTTLLGEVTYPFNVGLTDLDVADTFVVAVGNTRNESIVATPNAFDTGCGTDGLCDPTGRTNYKTADSFVARYSNDLQTTEALTFFGGSKAETSTDVRVNAENEIIITGNTRSTDLPVSSNAFDRTQNGSIDGFIAKFDSNLTSLIYASYVGGSDSDTPRVIAASSNGQVYLAGDTNSQNFPTTSGAFDQNFNGGDTDAFVSLFDTNGNAGVTDTGGSTGGGSTDTGGSGDNTPDSENNNPVANAGDDIDAESREKVYLNGRQSDDADGEIDSYQWKQVSGKSVKIKRSRSSKAKIKTPRVKRGKTLELIFELTVTDDQGAKDKDRVTVFVSR